MEFGLSVYSHVVIVLLRIFAVSFRRGCGAFNPNRDT